jgi:RHS repeat-associated protein
VKAALSARPQGRQACETPLYVYGPNDLPVEQINTEGKVLCLHHDQAGSTRLLTGSTGTAEGKCTYSAYGTPTCEGSATTPLGYDAQYTNTDTGLIYMRARVYDPATAQFLTVDPLVGQTHAPYYYAGDNPLNEADPTGPDLLGEIGNFPEPLNQVKYYEEEIESYENGRGYFASVAHALEAAVVGALDASGAGEEGLATEGADGGVDASTPTGQLGSPMDVPPGTNGPAEIDGLSYGGHALDEMQSEGFTPSVIQDTIATSCSRRCCCWQ